MLYRMLHLRGGGHLSSRFDIARFGMEVLRASPGSLT